MTAKKSFGVRDRTVKKTPLPKRAKQKADEEKKLDDTAKSYRDRGRREQERYDHAVNGDFWLAICFKDQESMDEFKDEFGFGELHARYWIDDLDLSDWEPKKPKRSFISLPPPRNLPKVPDPYATAERPEGATLEELTQIQFAALLDSLEAAKPPEPLRDVRFSDKYFVVIFESVPAKEKWLETTGLGPLGHKYLDGAAVQRTLRRNKE